MPKQVIRIHLINPVDGFATGSSNYYLEGISTADEHINNKHAIDITLPNKQLFYIPWSNVYSVEVVHRLEDIGNGRKLTIDEMIGKFFPVEMSI